jgi:isopentenyldiphosphate isomerase
MSNPLEMLEVVDENDNVVGLETRGKIHKEGLLHREIHIWFFTPRAEIIFQHRAKDKDTYPDKLDATVGGHVEPSMTYEETAIKECKEETGVDIDVNKLILLKKMRRKSFDQVTGLINNSMRPQYAYLYEGSIDDLQIEKGKSEGFEAWKIEKLYSLEGKDKDKFVSVIYDKEMIELFKKAQELLFK